MHFIYLRVYIIYISYVRRIILSNNNVERERNDAVYKYSYIFRS